MMIDTTVQVERNRKEQKKQTQEEKASALSLDAHLEAILYQFMQMYERFSEERKKVAQQNVAIAALVDEFSEIVVHVEELETHLRDTLQASIQKEAEKTADHLCNTLADEVSQHMQPTLETFQKKLNELMDPLIHRFSDLTFWDIKMMMVTLVTSFFINFCWMKWWMPVPRLPLTEAQWKTYTVGRKLEALWPTLSKEKQRWFLAANNTT